MTELLVTGLRGEDFSDSPSSTTVCRVVGNGTDWRKEDIILIPSVLDVWYAGWDRDGKMSLLAKQEDGQMLYRVQGDAFRPVDGFACDFSEGGELASAAIDSIGRLHVVTVFGIQRVARVTSPTLTFSFQLVEHAPFPLVCDWIWDDFSWKHEEIGPGSPFGANARVAIDGEDRPHVLIPAGGAGERARYYVRTSKGWESEEVPGFPAFGEVDPDDTEITLRLDAKGRPHILVHFKSGRQLYFAKTKRGERP